VKPRLIIVAVAALFLSGCFSPWHPFGTPVSRAEKAADKVEVASHNALVSSQEAVHKFNFALEAVRSGNLLALDVAQEHGRIAESLLDQVLGQPKVGEVQKWRDLVMRLVSENEKIRTAAEKENAKNFSKVSELSSLLEDRSKALEIANRKANEYAADLQAFKDKFYKVLWVIGGLVFLYFLGQILQFLANFNPAFETAANAVNAIVSPALHSAASKARKAAVRALS
jgi:hypothetical protein